MKGFFSICPVSCIRVTDVGAKGIGAKSVRSSLTTQRKYLIFKSSEIDKNQSNTGICVKKSFLFLFTSMILPLLYSGGFGGRGGHGGGRGGPMRGQPPYGNRGGPGGYSRDPYPPHPPPPSYMRERMDGYVRIII